MPKKKIPLWTASLCNLPQSFSKRRALATYVPIFHLSETLPSCRMLSLARNFVKPLAIRCRSRQSISGPEMPGRTKDAQKSKRTKGVHASTATGNRHTATNAIHMEEQDLPLNETFFQLWNPERPIPRSAAPLQIRVATITRVTFRKHGRIHGRPRKTTTKA